MKMILEASLRECKMDRMTGGGGGGDVYKVDGEERTLGLVATLHNIVLLLHYTTTLLHTYDLLWHGREWKEGDCYSILFFCVRWGKGVILCMNA